MVDGSRYVPCVFFLNSWYFFYVVIIFHFKKQYIIRSTVVHTLVNITTYIIERRRIINKEVTGNLSKMSTTSKDLRHSFFSVIKENIQSL